MSLQVIKVSKDEILKIVKENKNKHDGLLKEAVDGYWVDAEKYLKAKEKETLDSITKNHREQLKKLRKVRSEAIKTLKANMKADLELVKEQKKNGKFVYWQGKYPEDHSDDYEGTIRRLELSVEPNIELTSDEFDSYIRNKWHWREEFLALNSPYVTSYRTLSHASFAGSGSLGRIDF